MGIVVAWIVLSTIFALFSLTKDWVHAGKEGLIRFAHRDVEEAETEIEAMTEEYLASRGLDRPVWEQYLDWMGNMITLDWGQSHAVGEPVLPMLISATLRTLQYILPALVLGILVGTLVGLFAAMYSDNPLSQIGVGTAYLLFAVPGFWIGGMLFSLQWGDQLDHIEPVISYSPLLYEHVLPIFLATTTLLGGYVSYSRAHSLEYVSTRFITLIEAKGASRHRMAVHVVRNAAIPLFSMLFTEALALLVLSVFVIEMLFGIQGFGLTFFEAINTRDIPVLLGGTMFIIAFGVIGSILQDLSYNVLDPRVDTERERI